VAPLSPRLAASRHSTLTAVPLSPARASAAPSASAAVGLPLSMLPGSGREFDGGPCEPSLADEGSTAVLSTVVCVVGRGRHG
jgi:hypothetical protein